VCKNCEKGGRRERRSENYGPKRTVLGNRPEKGGPKGASGTARERKSGRAVRARFDDASES